jgi:hypothetical protein
MVCTCIKAAPPATPGIHLCLQVSACLADVSIHPLCLLTAAALTTPPPHSGCLLLFYRAFFYAQGLQVCAQAQTQLLQWRFGSCSLASYRCFSGPASLPAVARGVDPDLGAAGHLAGFPRQASGQSVVHFSARALLTDLSDDLALRSLLCVKLELSPLMCCFSLICLQTIKCTGVMSIAEAAW